MRELILLGVALAVALAGSESTRGPLTNDDVVRLVKAGFAEGIVLHAVEMNDGRYDLASEALASKELTPRLREG
jgi:hypothetical protein